MTARHDQTIIDLNCAPGTPGHNLAVKAHIGGELRRDRRDHAELGIVNPAQPYFTVGVDLSAIATYLAQARRYHEQPMEEMQRGAELAAAAMKAFGAAVDVSCKP
jgi:hypothetical protein